MFSSEGTSLLGSVELGGFFPSSCGRILSAVPEFEIQDLSPLAVASRPLREDPRSSRLEIHFLWTLCLDSAAQAKNFYAFGCTKALLRE